MMYKCVMFLSRQNPCVEARQSPSERDRLNEREGSQPAESLIRQPGKSEAYTHSTHLYFLC